MSFKTAQRRIVLLTDFGAEGSEVAISAGWCGGMEIDASAGGFGHFEMKTKTVAISLPACDDIGVTVNAVTGLQWSNAQYRAPSLVKPWLR